VRYPLSIKTQIKELVRLSVKLQKDLKNLPMDTLYDRLSLEEIIYTLRKMAR